MSKHSKNKLLSKNMAPKQAFSWQKLKEAYYANYQFHNFLFGLLLEQVYILKCSKAHFLYCTVQQRCTASLSDTLCFSSCPFNHFIIFVGSKMIVLFMSAEKFSSSFFQGRSANSITSYHVAFCH